MPGVEWAFRANATAGAGVVQVPPAHTSAPTPADRATTSHTGHFRYSSAANAPSTNANSPVDRTPAVNTGEYSAASSSPTGSVRLSFRGTGGGQAA